MSLRRLFPVFSANMSHPAPVRAEFVVPRPGGYRQCSHRYHCGPYTRRSKASCCANAATVRIGEDDLCIEHAQGSVCFCAVCHEDVPIGEMLRWNGDEGSSCCHYFCMGCTIDVLIHGGSSCPLCR